MAKMASVCLLMSVLCASVVFGRHYYDKPCYEELCYCNGYVARCIGNGNMLKFIPKMNWRKPIERIYFNYNFLGTIAKSTFKNIEHYQLTYLSLVGNHIKDIQKEAFHLLPKLKVLHLSDNIIPPKSLQTAFMNMKSLNYLYLNNMSLKTLPQDFFKGFRFDMLQGIHLTHNNLTTFDQRVTSHLKHLTTLNLKFNQISTVELVHSDSLGSLWLNSNLLQIFPDFCPGGAPLFPQLWTLSLEFNNITILNSSYFRCLTSLRKLFLSGNRFAQIPSNAFSNLTNLQMLNISQNRNPKFYLEVHAFNDSHFNFLNLSSSPFWYFSHKSFSYCNSLQTLDLSNTSVFHLAIYELLKRVDLVSFWCKNCNLKELPLGLKRMTGLKFLFLDGNYISDIPRHVFDTNVHLSHLSLKQNNLTTVSGFSITYSLRLILDYISLEDNPFDCNCDLLWLKNWINTDKEMFLGQFMNYKCNTPPNVKGLQILDVGIVSDKRCLLDHSPFTSVFSLVGAAFVCMLLIALVYKCRWNIRLCFMPKSSLRFSREGESRPLIQNDAYVVYCDDNYHPWVRNELMPNIEERKGLKLGIRQRDFNMSRHKVSNVVESLRICRKIIVVLSNNFFKDSESQDELALVLKCIEDQNGVLVVVLLEDIDNRYMSRPLYRLLEKTTQIKWPADGNQRDPFWRMLASSLSDSTLHSFS